MIDNIAQVRCPQCGWVDLQDTSPLNIEEGPQGEDLVTFRCRACGSEDVSVVTMRQECYQDDDFPEVDDDVHFGEDERWDDGEDF